MEKTYHLGNERAITLIPDGDLCNSGFKAIVIPAELKLVQEVINCSPEKEERGFLTNPSKVINKQEVYGCLVRKIKLYKERADSQGIKFDVNSLRNGVILTIGGRLSYEYVLHSFSNSCGNSLSIRTALSMADKKGIASVAFPSEALPDLNNEENLREVIKVFAQYYQRPGLVKHLGIGTPGNGEGKAFRVFDHAARYIDSHLARIFDDPNANERTPLEESYESRRLRAEINHNFGSKVGDDSFGFGGSGYSTFFESLFGGIR